MNEEFSRIGKLFVSYSTFVISGILIAVLFSLFYAGIKANYISIEILAAVISTLVFLAAVVICIGYMANRRKAADLLEDLHQDAASPEEVFILEELRCLLAQQLPQRESQELAKLIVMRPRHLKMSIRTPTKYRRVLQAVRITNHIEHMVLTMTLGLLNLTTLVRESFAIRTSDDTDDFK